MSVPATKQIVLIPGELQIDSSAGYKETSGLISFIGAFKTKLGQIRAYGYGAFQSMLMDSSNCSVGFEVRTTTNQGDPSLLGGKGDQFPLTIVSDVTKIKSLEVTQTPTSYKNQFTGESIAKVVRQNTTSAPTLVNSILDIVQNQWKEGETMQVNLGASTFSGCSVWSYTLPTSTSSSAADNYSSLSMKRNNTTIENIRMLTTGNVSIPLRLDVGTISATTYLNLPPVPSSELLPITLDSAQGRVGINQTTPAAALDVTGNGHFTGTLDASDIAVHNSVLVEGDATIVGTLDVRQDIDINRNLNVLGDATIFRLGVIDSVSAYKYFSGSSFLVGGTGDPEGNVEGTPASIYMRSDTGDVYTKTGLGTTGWTKVGSTPDLSPITLDKANSRVGINKAVPTTALDVGGTVSATGLVVSGDTTTSTLTLTTIPAKTTQTNVIYYDTSTKAVSYGTVPEGGDLLPITLDKVNNRVGINNATPGAPLHVIGNIRAGWIVDSVAIGNRAGWSGVAGEQQKTNAVAVGVDAGTKNQGIYGTAIGAGAGSTDQKSYAVAVGYQTGFFSQGESGTAIGQGAGRASQGDFATGLGCQAGYSGQGTHATAVGSFAGYNNQGQYAVAIGARAGLESQHANSIIINGTIDTLNSNGASRFFVKPVRQDTAQTNYVLHYNPTTGEITYGS